MASKQSKKFTWTVQFTVDKVWIEDGFNLTADRALDMILNDLSSATSSEVKAKILTKPADSDMAKAQGYSTAKEWKTSY